jgi:hypothetical protein
MARFFGWDYAGTLAMMATLGFAPLLVLQIAGPGANANYHLAWTIAYSLYLIGRSMGTSLLAEGVADRARLPSLAADTFVYTMLPVTAAAALVIGAAPLIMGLFGPAYADEGTPLLRVLALSTVPWALSTIYLALVRANGRMVAVALVEGATLLLVLGLGALLLPRMGVLGIGIAWLVTNTGVAIAIAIVVLLRNGFEQTTHLLLGLTPSITGSATALGLWRHKLRASVGLDPALDAFLRKSCLPGAASFRPLQTETSSNEVTTVTLGVYGGPLAAGGHEEGPETARLLLKTAKSQRGVASLERYLERLQTLRRERRLDDCGFGLPEILAVKQTRDAIHLVERAPPGEDGQTFLQRRSSRADALSAAVRCIALLHDRTAAPARIGESWLADWIDRPIDLVGRALSTRRQREAFDAFRREQYAFWHEQVLRLGWGHGDFGPAHIVFAAANRQCGGRAAEIDATVSVEGIINWSTARADTPAGLDACHLALATHALVQGVEFSQIVSRLLVDPAPVLDDDIWLACTAGLTDAPRGWPHDTRAIRAMVGLAWLNHSIARLDIANGHAAQRLWTSSHVEQVVLAFSPDRAAGEK